MIRMNCRKEQSHRSHLRKRVRRRKVKKGLNFLLTKVLPSLPKAHPSPRCSGSKGFGDFYQGAEGRGGRTLGGVGVLDPPAKLPFTIRERFCEKIHKVCVRSAKIVHVLQKEFK